MLMQLFSNFKASNVSVEHYCTLYQIIFLPVFKILHEINSILFY